MLFDEGNTEDLVLLMNDLLVNIQVHVMIGLVLIIGHHDMILQEDIEVGVEILKGDIEEMTIGVGIKEEEIHQ